MKLGKHGVAGCKHAYEQKAWDVTGKENAMGRSGIVWHRAETERIALR
ncbi:MAG: hypothetical protein GY924_27925 [Planctomycetaceae bacterium]|nr:hypothetical protein [Planctomycetaceae bacterium]